MKKLKILVFLIEHDEKLLLLLGSILKRRYTLMYTNCEETAARLFSQNHHDIDVVIVDFYIEHGVKLMKELGEIDLGKPVVTISGSYTCSVKEGCDFCLENYNRKRLMMPFSGDHLIQAIESFPEFKCQLEGECEPPNPKNEPFLF